MSSDLNQIQSVNNNAMERERGGIDRKGEKEGERDMEHYQERDVFRE